MDPSDAAQLARRRLHEEIERVRRGVEEMLDEQESRAATPGGEDLRRELEQLRIETRAYVKRRVRRSEKKLKRSFREIEARSDALERRLEEVEAGREEAEWRIHSNTEQMLDGLLQEVRAIADRLAGHPPPPGPAPALVRGK